MRLKSFHAKSMSEAMKQVRDLLGEDAIIVSSREEKSGWVKITAAIEKEPAPPPEDAHDAEAALEELTDTLLRHRIPASVSDKLMSVAMTRTEKTSNAILAAALAKTFRFETPAVKKPLALVGPPGAGKTLTTAKLAARAVMEDARPFVVTTDIARAGGVEQLSAFLDILGVPLAEAKDAAALKTLLAHAEKNTPVFIDTGGLNPFDPQEMKELAKILAVADMTSALVLPAGTDAEESAEMAMTFSILGVKRLIPTRLDFARRIGGILSAADRAGLAFTEGSHTPQVANGLKTLDAATLADLLIPPSLKKK